MAEAVSVGMLRVRVHPVVVCSQVVSDLVYVREIDEAVRMHDGVTERAKSSRGASHRKPERGVVVSGWGGHTSDFLGNIRACESQADSSDSIV